MNTDGPNAEIPAPAQISESDDGHSGASSTPFSRHSAAPREEVAVRSEKNGGEGEGQRRWYHPLSILGLLVDNWFLIGIGVFIVLAWRFPSVGKEGGSVKSQYTVHYGAIALIFLITGLTLSTTALYAQIKNWYLHLFTQVFSLLLFPTIIFALINIIRASHNGQIDRFILVGIMVMGAMPTTVASNITMTRVAKGNTEAATAEVCIGQIFGIFLSPLLLQMFFSSTTWAYGQPAATGGKSSSDGLKEIYKQVSKQTGLAIFLPMFVGQVIQNLFPTQTKWVATTFRLPKVSKFFLLILIWSVFSNQFANDAFSSVPGGSIALVVVLNLVLYLFFTVLCVTLARLPFLPRSYSRNVSGSNPSLARRTVMAMRFGKKETTAICFCAAAKGLVVGSPILDILYGGFPETERAIISIPLVLYQGEQIAVAQLLTYLFRRWNERPDEYELKEDLLSETQEGQREGTRR